jgi:hypothetical protein
MFNVEENKCCNRAGKALPDRKTAEESAYEILLALGAGRVNRLANLGYIDVEGILNLSLGSILSPGEKDQKRKRHTAKPRIDA